MGRQIVDWLVQGIEKKMPFVPGLLGIIHSFMKWEFGSWCGRGCLYRLMIMWGLSEKFLTPKKIP